MAENTTESQSRPVARHIVVPLASAAACRVVPDCGSRETGSLGGHSGALYGWMGAPGRKKEARRGETGQLGKSVRILWQRARQRAAGLLVGVGLAMAR